MRNRLLFFCLMFVPGLAFSQWTWQNPLPQGNPLYSLHFIDNSTGFAVGEGGTILKTTDGGVKWNQVLVGTTSALHSLFFVNTGLAFCAGDNGTLLKTVDGGSTWITISPGGSTAFLSVYFRDAVTGYLAGGGGDYPENNG